MGEERTSDAAPDPASAIRRRLALFRTERDPRYLTDRRADAELAAAMTATVRAGRAGETECDVATLAELTRFRFWRGVVSGTAPGQVEADDAVGFFLGLRQTSPDLTAVTNGLGGSRAGLPGSGGTGLGNPAVVYEAVVLDVTCSCGLAHPPREPGATDAGAGGCGVSFRIELAAGHGPDGGRP